MRIVNTQEQAQIRLIYKPSSKTETGVEVGTTLGILELTRVVQEPDLSGNEIFAVGKPQI